MVKVLDCQFGKERKYKKLKSGYANGKYSLCFFFNFLNCSFQANLVLTMFLGAQVLRALI